MGVAQLVEHLVVVQDVAGSSPVTHPMGDLKAVALAGGQMTTPTERRGIRLEQFTIGYNIIEGVIAVSSGVAAGFVSLIGFGIDSGIEVFAAALVLVRLRCQLTHGTVDEAKEVRSLKIIAVTFFALALYVSVHSLHNLLTGEMPTTSYIGIGLTLASVVVMPWLAHMKRTTGEKLQSRLLIADAMETKLCAWLSVSTLAGLVGYRIFGWTWLDSLASLVIAGFALVEGKEAWAGELACDDCACLGTCTC